jgi:hypothetical protein
LARVKISLPTIKKLEPRKIHNTIFGDKLAKGVKGKVLDLVSVGVSPVKGKGRFKAYAAQRSSALGSYPNIPRIREKYPSKKTRPVNLYLDGSYLEAVTKHTNKSTGIEFGLINASEFNRDLFKTHNEGKNRNVPQRKVIPTKGEGFVESVNKIIKDIYLQRIRNIIRFGG